MAHRTRRLRGLTLAALRRRKKSTVGKRRDEIGKRAIRLEKIEQKQARRKAGTLGRARAAEIQAEPKDRPNLFGGLLKFLNPDKGKSAEAKERVAENRKSKPGFLERFRAFKRTAPATRSARKDAVPASKSRTPIGDFFANLFGGIG